MVWTLNQDRVGLRIGATRFDSKAIHAKLLFDSNGRTLLVGVDGSEHGAAKR